MLPIRSSNNTDITLNDHPQTHRSLKSNIHYPQTVNKVMIGVAVRVTGGAKELRVAVLG